jgi:hypothetical protein
MGRSNALACTRTHAMSLPGAALVGLSGVRVASVPLLLNSALTASFAITAPLTATPDAQHATMAHLANHPASAHITRGVKRVASTSRSMRCVRDDANKHDLRVATRLGQSTVLCNQCHSEWETGGVAGEWARPPVQSFFD